MRSSGLAAFVLATVLGAAGATAGCNGVAAPPAQKPRGEAEVKPTEPPDPSAPIVWLKPDGRPPVRVTVEVVRTSATRAEGLMFREHLAEDAGMLFLFARDENHSFWMRNTLIPLDMIFINADLTVAGVVANAEPRSDVGRTIGVPSRHVLEVVGGFARTHGITRGTRLQFENISLEDIDP